MAHYHPDLDGPCWVHEARRYTMVDLLVMTCAAIVIVAALALLLTLLFTAAG